MGLNFLNSAPKIKQYFRSFQKNSVPVNGFFQKSTITELLPELPEPLPEVLPEETPKFCHQGYQEPFLLQE